MEVSNKYKWLFARKYGGRDDGPNDAMGQGFVEAPLESFVREAIQNSIDARDNFSASPVTVSFESGYVSRNELPGLFDIYKHIYACNEYWKENDKTKKFKDMLSFMNEKKDHLEYLCFSDFNTVGMEYRDNDVMCGFYAFTKSGGNSVKNKNTSQGSYGFGKAALINMSKIRTVFVSTMLPDRRCFFAGISSLSTHIIDGFSRESQGYFTLENEERPVSEIESIPPMFRRSEPGTSFYLIGTDIASANSEYEKEIIKSVLKSFWLCIYKNELVVKIQVKDELFSQAVEIKKDSLLYLTENTFRKNERSSPLPYIKTIINAEHQIGKDFLFFHEEKRCLGEVCFYIWKTPEGSDCVQNMRSAHMVIYNDNRNTGYGYYGIFICESEKGNALLKECEDASHRKWDSMYADEDLRKYTKEALDEREQFIQESIEKAFDVSFNDGIDIEGLEEILSVREYSDEDYEKFLTDDVVYNTKIGDLCSLPVNKNRGGIVTDILPPSPAASDSDGDEKFDQTAAGNITKKKNRRQVIKDKEENIKDDEDKKNNPKQKDLWPSGGAKENMNNIDNGLPSVSCDLLSVRYRVYTKKQEGLLCHVIILHSNIETENANILITIPGEEYEEALPIIYTDKGNFMDNKLINVPLKAGKNIINIRFESQLKHGLNIKAYE